MDIFNLTVNFSDWNSRIFYHPEKAKRLKVWSNFIKITTRAFSDYYLSEKFQGSPDPEKQETAFIQEALVDFFERIREGVENENIDWDKIPAPFPIIYFSDHDAILDFAMLVLTRAYGSLATSGRILEASENPVEEVDAIFQAYNFSRDIFEETFRTHFSNQ